MAKSTAGMPTNSNQGFGLFNEGLTGGNNVFGTPLGQLMMQDMLASSLAAAQFQPSRAATDMMAAGRPSFNWGLMGAVGPLAGALPQPEYTTPPPEFSTRYWHEFDAGSTPSRTSGTSNYYTTPMPFVVGSWGN